jgi:hypothetical protein
MLGRFRRRDLALHQLLHRRRLRLDPGLHGSPGRKGESNRQRGRRSHRRGRPRDSIRQPARLRQLRLDHAHDLRPAGAAAGQLHAHWRRLALPPSHGAHSQASGSHGRAAHAHRRPRAVDDRRHAAQADRLHHARSQRPGKDLHPAGRPANRGNHNRREAVRTRDHSELALRAFGATLTRTWILSPSPARRRSTPSRPPCPATSLPPPSFSAPPRSSPAPAWCSIRSDSTPRAPRCSTCSPPWAQRSPSSS